MRRRTNLGFMLALTLVLATPGMTVSCFAATDAALSGVVRDSHGVPQMGALVQLFTADATAVATAFTDNRGRYLIHAVIPGRYQLRASAAFFMPASRPNVRLQAGAQTIINLTMSTLYEAENWLPAQKRRADEPVDDWKWTLRSSANRPLLRIVADENDDGTVLVSSSAETSHRAKTHAAVSVTSGDGGLGQGGVHQVLVLDRVIENGDGAVLRADVAGSRAPFPVQPSAELTAGYERRSPFGGNTRLVASYQTHPELTDGAATGGAQVMRLASTQEFKFGDTFVIDAGSLMQAERLQSTRLSTEPFFRMTVRPMSGVLVEYRYATGRELQSSEDLDRLKPGLRVLTDGNGRPLSSKGSHHEVSVSRKLGNRVVQVAAYTDHLDNVAINGSGTFDSKDLALAAILADPTTARFALTSADYSGRGVSVSMVQPITPSLSAWFGYDLGTALTSTMNEDTMIAAAAKEMVAHNSYAASASLRGKILRTGTTVRAEYRWQPMHTLTQVNAFNVSDQNAYLGLYVRQRLWCGRWLPDGIDAVIDATNLLAQGYQPVVSGDGHVLYLAQAPRAIQGGFAFNF